MNIKYTETKKVFTWCIFTEQHSNHLKVSKPKCQPLFEIKYIIEHVIEAVEEGLHAHLDVLLDVFSSAHETLNLVREIKLQHM